ncbi:hypothetical protein F7725_014962 [Dissostichus mawsoni]|uniref:Uncharacterized protein n=1 Tax=Dissostichus mawsoni TaxID=36200 RepID=A0A7J5YGC3_DISMA|nr:hypothetical protein F7725_014962 [Dissostichus mawsoni]
MAAVPPSAARGSSASRLDVPFPSPRDASIALGSLSPDREPRKGDQQTADGDGQDADCGVLTSSDPPGLCELFPG